MEAQWRHDALDPQMELLGLIVIVFVAFQFLQFLGEDPKGFSKVALGAGIFVLSLAGLFFLVGQMDNEALRWLIGVPWTLGTVWLIGRLDLL